jgi:hypothetical protein
MKIRSRCSDDNWEKALLSKDVEKIKELCQIENSFFTLPPGGSRVEQDVSFGPFLVFALAVEYKIPLNRFIYLVKYFNELPKLIIFQFACGVNNWPVVDYLHTQGLKHGVIEYYLIHLLNTPNEERAVRVNLCYPKWQDKYHSDNRSLKEDETLLRIRKLTMIRKQNALKASVAILSLKKKHGKDVLRIIAKMIMHHDNVAKEEWGHLSFTQDLKITYRSRKEPLDPTMLFCFFLTVCFWLIFLK